MADWPQCDTKITQDKRTKIYKAVAKTDLPCGATQIEVYEHSNANVASAQVKVACVRAGREHIIRHRCNE